MTGAAAPRSSIAFLLKDADCFPVELEHLERSELESLRSAIDGVLARRSADDSRALERTQDDGFSCEWWPPS
jgi:hypothetical protein